MLDHFLCRIVLCVAQARPDYYGNHTAQLEIITALLNVTTLLSLSYIKDPRTFQEFLKSKKLFTMSLFKDLTRLVRRKLGCLTRGIKCLRSLLAPSPWQELHFHIL